MADYGLFQNRIENQVKTALRLSTDFFDEAEIRPMINACLLDMEGAGVNMDGGNKHLIAQAVVFYCKANFGLENSDKWQLQYERTRDALAARTAEAST